MTAQQQLAPQNDRAAIIKPFLIMAHKQIQSLMADKAKADKFTATALVIAADPALAKCNPQSIVQACIGVAMTGLSLDKNKGQAYLVPYKQGDSYGVQVQIGYKGYILDAWRAGWQVKADFIYDVDHYTEENNGFDDRITFVKNHKERLDHLPDWAFEHLIGVRVVARHVSTGADHGQFISKGNIERLRLNSPNQKKVFIYQNESDWVKKGKERDRDRLAKGLPIGIWEQWYPEMAMGKAFKKFIKLLPLGDDMRTVDLDDKVVSTQEQSKQTAAPLASLPPQNAMLIDKSTGEILNPALSTATVDYPVAENDNYDNLIDSEEWSEPEPELSDGYGDMPADGRTPPDADTPTYKGKTYIKGALLTCKSNNELIAYWQQVPDNIKTEFQQQFEERQDALRHGD